MIPYLKKKNVVSIDILLSTITGYVVLGFIDDITVPLLECYVSKKEREILYHRFMTKMMVWLIVVLFCLRMEKKFGV